MGSAMSKSLRLLLCVYVATTWVRAATLGTLQSEGDAIYDMSQAMPSLLTLAGRRPCNFIDSIA